ncbi:phage major capsid protein, P2 family [Endozoicomonas ascidiicola]|uniref:phage major capsid protein, P2 family n=1 Tax=Endozoicomonas ascidiicola TaxID=1698521 RepID=UPI0008304327|nr:phage major capsid protein, P2 family [Endozoicomonas ascidiicola]
MNKDTRKQFNVYLGDLREVNDIEDTSVSFSVVPTAVQGLQDMIVEQSTFLPKINVIGVEHKEGQNVKTGITGPASGRTKTTRDIRRQPKRSMDLAVYGYKMEKVDTDLEMTYDQLDAWAHLGDLNKRIRQYAAEQIANDREIIGWYGESVAENSDPSENTMLEDVNKGWLQYMRDNKPENVLSEVVESSGEIRIGAGGDFENLDAVVVDLMAAIPKFLRKDLTVLVGDDLLMQQKSRIYSDNSLTPSEKAQAIAALREFGSLTADSPSNFPERGLVITSLKNLSIYHQTGSHRRNIKEETEYNRWMDYNSRNEAYVVETPEAFVALEFKNVKLKDGDTWV